jgi:hypothetical protein
MTQITQVDALQALLSANLEIETDVFVKRLGASFRIKAVDTSTLEKAREQAIQTSGSGSKRASTVNAERLNAILVAKFCVTPNFGDAALLAKYGVTNAVECVGKALLPGEIVRIVAAGMDLSGYGEDGDEINEIKN